MRKADLEFEKILQVKIFNNAAQLFQFSLACVKIQTTGFYNDNSKFVKENKIGFKTELRTI